MPVLNPTVVFSDVDGTLVHYKDALEKQGYTLIRDCDPPNLAPPTPDLAGETSFPFPHGYLQDITAGLTPTDHQRTNLHQSPPQVGIWRHDATGEEIEVFRVPSATLGGGYISCRTLHLVDTLRAHDIKFVIITGARSSTWELRRLSGTVPSADIDVTEGGGKMWHQKYPDGHLAGLRTRVSATARLRSPNSNLKTVDYHNDSLAGIVPPPGKIPLGHCIHSELDVRWLDKFVDGVGPWRDNATVTDPLKRSGQIWDLYREVNDKYTRSESPDFVPAKMDAKHYVSAFLMDYRAAASARREQCAKSVDLEDEIRELFQTTLGPKYNARFCTNLGKAHVSPKGLSKATVARYIAEEIYGLVEPTSSCSLHLDTRMAMSCVALFDDENDLEFAAECGVGFMPSVSHPRVLEALKSQGCDGATKYSFEEEMKRREAHICFAKSEERRKLEDSRCEGLLDMAGRERLTREQEMKHLLGGTPDSPKEEPRWFRATHDGLLGTEEALCRVLRMKLQFKVSELPPDSTITPAGDPDVRHIKHIHAKELEEQHTLLLTDAQSSENAKRGGLQQSWNVAPPPVVLPGKVLSFHQQWVEKELVFNCYCSKPSTAVALGNADQSAVDPVAALCFAMCRHEELHLETRLFTVDVLELLREEERVFQLDILSRWWSDVWEPYATKGSLMEQEARRLEVKALRHRIESEVSTFEPW